ncbi:MAG TPA: hypothetical protein IAB59_04115 [Candidatus Onthousia faecipullorum]|uniref:Uncharacterized protein n=1 Tax=Candidatus Onthousia faecipullorum TaxID=2840887 RepID=A0A9D1KBY6_9FIRM|nr:hypothetical protein [Candidatus Onthousia faecipullorum]
MKKNKKDLKKDQKRIVKWLKVVIILCIAIIVVELGYILLSYYNRTQSIIYTDTLNSFKETDDGYLVVGNSDFKKSKFNDYEKDDNKAKFAKYNNDFEIEFESAYTKGYSSYFSDVIEYSDGYIAVGGAQYDEQQVSDNATDGLIVLYDKEGNQKDSKRLQIAGDTTFNKVILLDDGFLVIGQSILQNMVIGTNPNAGALIVKYDFDFNEVWRANYGGSKSGNFNDAVIDGDYIYLVGKDATRYGLIAKYTLDGERVYAKSYEYTDTIGFSSIVKVGDELFVAGSKTINIDAKDADKVTEGLIVKYDSDGNVLDEVTFKKNNNARFNKIVYDGDNLVVVGHTYKIDEEKSTDTYNYLDYRGIIVKYNRNLGRITDNKENGEGVDYFSDVIVNDDGYLVGGASSSRELGSNNKDYRTYFLQYNKDLERQWYK